MKTFLTLLITLTCFVGRLMGDIASLPMGSAEAVELHGVKNSRELYIYIYQPNPKFAAGYQIVGKYVEGGLNFSNKKDLDYYFLKNFERAALGAITNDWKQNRDGQFYVSAFFAQNFDDNMDGGRLVPYFEIRKSFKLVRIANNSYTLPDFRGFKMDPSLMVYYHVPDLKWSRILTTSREGYSSLMDSAIHETSQIDLHDHILSIPRDVAISGTNGPTRVKISLVSGEDNIFQTFDAVGNPALEKRSSVKLSRASEAELKAHAKGASEPYPGLLSIKLQTGEPGRSYRVQGAPTPSGPWTSIEYALFTYWPEKTSSLVLEMSEENAFFRVIPENQVPLFFDE